MMGSPKETHWSSGLLRLIFHSSAVESVGVGVLLSVVLPALPKPFHSAVQSGRFASGLVMNALGSSSESRSV